MIARENEGDSIVPMSESRLIFISDDGDTARANFSEDSRACHTYSPAYVHELVISVILLTTLVRATPILPARARALFAVCFAVTHSRADNTDR